MKKYLCLTIVLAMVLSAVSACGGGGDSGGNASSDSSGGAASSSGNAASSSGDSAQAEDGPEEITTFRVVYFNEAEGYEFAGTPVGDVFIERTGVNLTFEGSYGGSWQESAALAIASGDLPDLVDGADMAMFVEAGVALEITEWAETYAPNLVEAYMYEDGWATRHFFSPDKKERYGMKRFNHFPQDTLEQEGWHHLQNAVVIDQGFPKMETVKDYENAIRAYMEKYPTIDGQPTIGMTMLTYDWFWIVSMTNHAFISCENMTAGEFMIDENTHEVIYHHTLYGEAKEYIRWLNHMYNEGLLDRESFTQTFDEFKAKIASGRVLAVHAPTWMFAYDAMVTLRQEGKEERMYGTYPIVLREGLKNGTLGQNNALVSGIDGVFATTACKDPQKLFEFLNYYVTEEGQILRYWGIEGMHYDIIDGKRVFKPEEREKMQTDPDYGKKTGIGLFSFLPGYERTTKDSTGQYFGINTKADVMAGYTDTDRLVLSAYGADIWTDLFPQQEDFPTRPWPNEASMQTLLPADSAGSIAFNRCMDVVKKDVSAAIMAKPEDFDAAWDTYVININEAGRAIYEQEMYDMIKEQMDIWGLDF